MICGSLCKSRYNTHQAESVVFFICFKLNEINGLKKSPSLELFSEISIVCPFLLTTVLSVLLFKTSDYPFGIFKVFFVSFNSNTTSAANGT